MPFPETSMQLVSKDNFEYINPTELKRRFGHSLTQIVTIFIEESPQLITKLENSYQSQDKSVLMNAVHNVKGSLGMMSACALADLGARIEEALVSSPESEFILPLWEELVTGIHSLTGELSEFHLRLVSENRMNKL